MTDHVPAGLTARSSPSRVILAVILPYWVWLAAYNVLVAQAVLATGFEVMRLAPPDARIAQHALLLPLAILAYRLAWHIGALGGRWWLALPAHLLIGLGFASLARVALNLGITLFPTPWMTAEDVAMRWGDGVFYDWFITDVGLWQRATLEFFFNYVFGMALLVGLRIYLELRDEKLAGTRLREEWLKARLDALAGQLNPHFLFNSLHTVASFVRADPERAEKMVADLSQLLRTTLRERERPYASLAEELEFIERYLQIERTRFEDRLTTQIDADGAVLNARVPSLLLQPLIENAIKHGVSRARGPARLEVRASREGERLRIVVRNTWRPNDSEASPVGEHIGLRNVHERLETLYGTDQSLRSGPAGDFWEVEVSLPFGDRGREETR